MLPSSGSTRGTGYHLLVSIPCSFCPFSILKKRPLRFYRILFFYCWEWNIFNSSKAGWCRGWELCQHRDSNSIMKSNCSFKKQQLFAILISKRSLSECGIGWKWWQSSFSGVLLGSGSWKSLFKSPTHRPSHKAGGKITVVLKTMLCCNVL